MTSTVKWSNPLLWVAVVLLAAYGVFTMYLVRHVGDADIGWTRMIWIYEGVQALVFGTAGAMFGTTIQGSRLRSTQEDLKAARHEAKSNAKQASGVKAVHEALTTTRDHAIAAGRRASAGGGSDLGQQRVGGLGQEGRTGLPAGEDLIGTLEWLTAFADRVLGVDHEGTRSSTE